MQRVTLPAFLPRILRDRRFLISRWRNFRSHALNKVFHPYSKVHLDGRGIFERFRRLESAPPIFSRSKRGKTFTAAVQFDLGDGPQLQPPRLTTRTYTG